MNDKRKFRICFISLFLILFIFIGCDSNSGSEYPAWFYEYSGTDLANLKMAQDDFECFGDTIGNVEFKHAIDYDSSTKFFLNELYSKNATDIIDATDIQPFRDGAIANGYVEDETENDLYIKGNKEFSIYVISTTGDDAHFEIILEIADQ